MEKAVAIVALLAVLFLVARGTRGRNLLAITAIVLTLVLAIVMVEQAGWWPRDWRVR